MYWLSKDGHNSEGGSVSKQGNGKVQEEVLGHSCNSHERQSKARRLAVSRIKEARRTLAGFEPESGTMKVI